MYHRRRLGPRPWVRAVLCLPPSILFPTLGFLYMVFLDHPRRPRPLAIALAAPLTVLAHTQDVAGAALFMTLDVVLWFTGLNLVLTGLGWLFEKPRPPGS